MAEDKWTPENSYPLLRATSLGRQDEKRRKRRRRREGKESSWKAIVDKKFNLDKRELEKLEEALDLPLDVVSTCEGHNGAFWSQSGPR